MAETGADLPDQSSHRHLHFWTRFCPTALLSWTQALHGLQPREGTSDQNKKVSETSGVCSSGLCDSQGTGAQNARAGTAQKGASKI